MSDFKMESEEFDSSQQNSHFELSQKTRRRKLLPWWIKVFIWVFMLLGLISPIGLIFGFIGFDFNLSLYGLETINPLSLTGLSIVLLFSLKGVVSYGLWFEKKWAISLGQIDAVLGMSICVFVMIIIPFLDLDEGFKLNFKLELLFLIPYFVKLSSIKDHWIDHAISESKW